MPVFVLAASKYEIRLLKEAKALFDALRRYVCAIGGEVVGVDPEDKDAFLKDVDGVVTRASYMTAVDVCGLIVVKAQFPDGSRTFVTAPGIYFGAAYRRSLDALIGAVEPQHRAELVEKDLLHGFALDADGRPRRIQLRPNRKSRRHRSRKMGGSWRPPLPPKNTGDERRRSKRG